MYNSHFGLHRAPFKITPDTTLFYKGGQRGRVLEALVYAIVSGEGIIKVVGEVGTGKTMLCRMLDSVLPSNVEIVYLANPSLEPGEIHHAIALELGLTLELNSSRLEVLHLLQQHLLDKYARNQHVVVLVEEAQGVPKATLEEIRLLSNLETRQDKLLQVVLFGQPELDTLLSDPGIRQLRERITHSFRLEPFGRDEVREYVNFRLRSAGFRGRDVFDERAYAMLASASKGLSRRINILADKAMLAAFADDTHDVRRRHVKVAVDDSNMSRRIGAARSWGWPEAVVASGALVLIAALALAFVLPREGLGGLVPATLGSAPPQALEPADGSSGGESAQARGGAAGPAGAGTAASAVLASEGAAGGVGTSPAPVTAARTDEAEEDADEMPAPGEVSGAEPMAAGELGPAGGTERVALAAAMTSAGRPPAEDSPAAEAQAEPDGGIEASLAERGRAVAETAHIDTPPRAAENTAMPALGPTGPRERNEGSGAVAGGATPAPANSEGGQSGTLLDERVAAALSWIQGQPDAGEASRYSIQIMVSEASNRVPLERFLRQRSDAGDVSSIFCYPMTLNGREVYTVFYGEFASFKAASTALSALPTALRRYGPYVRNVGQLAARARRNLATAYFPAVPADTAIQAGPVGGRGPVATPSYMRYAVFLTGDSFSES